MNIHTPPRKKSKVINELIKKLALEPLPGEGGYFRQTYKSPIETSIIFKEKEPAFQRSLGTSIYYLVTPEEFSALHRVRGDEIFHFYLGDPVEMLQIDENGKSRKIILGPNVLGGQEVQVIVPAGTWQGARLVGGGEYALLGATVIPGFDSTDFELSNRRSILFQLPHIKDEIKNYTRN